MGLIPLPLLRQITFKSFIAERISVDDTDNLLTGMNLPRHLVLLHFSYVTGSRLFFII